jgi:hypothetical protein
LHFSIVNVFICIFVYLLKFNPFSAGRIVVENNDVGGDMTHMNGPCRAPREEGAGWLIGKTFFAQGQRPGERRGGRALYLVNFYGFTALFFWFVAARNWVVIVDHLVFGPVMAWSYVAMTRPHAGEEAGKAAPLKGKHA